MRHPEDEGIVRTLDVRRGSQRDGLSGVHAEPLRQAVLDGAVGTVGRVVQE